MDVCLKLLQETLAHEACLEWVEENKSKIKSLRDEVQSIDSSIVELYDRFEIEDSDESYIKETEEQIQFMISIDKQLNEVALKFKSKNDTQAVERVKDVGQARKMVFDWNEWQGFAWGNAWGITWGMKP